MGYARISVRSHSFIQGGDAAYIEVCTYFFPQLCAVQDPLALNAIITEMLRMYTDLLAKRLCNMPIGSAVIAGVWVPTGTVVYVALYLLQCISSVTSALDTWDPA